MNLQETVGQGGPDPEMRRIKIARCNRHRQHRGFIVGEKIAAIEHEFLENLAKDDALRGVRILKTKGNK
jgi:hypothetical protein